MPQRAGQTVRVLLERDELDASLDGDAARLEVIGEHGFRVGLRDEQNVPKACVCAIDVAEIDGSRPCAIEMQHQARGGLAACRESLAQTDRLKELRLRG